MTSDIEQELFKYRTFLEQILELAREQMVNSPEGSLQIYHEKDKIKYYYHQNGKRKYIRKTEMEAVKRLAQKSYVEYVYKRVNSQLVLINRFLQKFDPALMKNIHEHLSSDHYNLIKPFYEKDQIFLNNWIDKPYEANDYMAEEKNIRTNNEEFVRSKGEKILADKLHDMGIPYKYECPLYIKGYGHIYPDFTIMNLKKREEVYIELFGMMDNPDYCVHALKKIDFYEKQKIIPGKNLICVFESSRKVLDTAIFELLIRDILE